MHFCSADILKKTNKPTTKTLNVDKIQKQYFIFSRNFIGTHNTVAYHHYKITYIFKKIIPMHCILLVWKVLSLLKSLQKQR